MLRSTRTTALMWLLFATCAPIAIGQGSGAAPELLIEQIKKTVVYLQGDFPCHVPRIVGGVPVSAADGSPVFDTGCSQVGTGFLLIYPTPEMGTGMGVPLLVTSKHLIQHQRVAGPKGEMQYFDAVKILANTKESHSDGSFISPVPIIVKEDGFLSCSIDRQDPDADVAVCPINIPDSIYDFKGISPEMLLNNEKIAALKINETDEVLFSGLFLPYHGAKRNYPIVRHGKLALIPQEKIPWATPDGNSSMQDLYLAEITSWGGNSGSPVFVRLTGAREQGSLMAGVQYVLLGVMMGYFNSDRPASLDTAAITDTAHLQVQLSDNSGIAAIVPATKILDIIGQPRVKAYVSLVKAISYLNAGRNQDAEASFKEAISTLQNSDPDHPLLREAFQQYAGFLQRIGRYPEASFQLRLASAIKKVGTLQDDQLR